MKICRNYKDLHTEKNKNHNNVRSTLNVCLEKEINILRRVSKLISIVTYISKR